MAAVARVIWLCTRVRYWPGRGLVYVCPCNYFSYFIFLLISNLGELETVMKTVSNWNSVVQTQSAFDSFYNNQGLQTREIFLPSIN